MNHTNFWPLKLVWFDSREVLAQDFPTSLPSRIIAHLETLPLQWCELLFYQFRQSLQNILWVNWLEWLVAIVTNHSSSLVLPLFGVVTTSQFCQIACFHKWFLLCDKIGAIQLSKSEQPIPTYYKMNLWTIYFGSVMASSHDLTNASTYMPM